ATIEYFRDKLGRLGNTPYTLAGIDGVIEGAPFVPASLLNDLRRLAVDDLQSLQSSPPQLRRGGAQRRGGAGPANDFIDQHHPNLGLPLGFALSGSRFAASVLPS